MTDSKRGADIAFLKHLLKRYRGRHVFLFFDNCSIHCSRTVRRLLADHAHELTPIWNAPYTPELNLIERYWGHLRRNATNNYYFGTLENLKEAIRDAISAFNRTRDRKALQVSMLHSLCRDA